MTPTEEDISDLDYAKISECFDDVLAHHKGMWSIQIFKKVLNSSDKYDSDFILFLKYFMKSYYGLSFGIKQL